MISDYTYAVVADNLWRPMSEHSPMYRNIQSIDVSFDGHATTVHVLRVPRARNPRTAAAICLSPGFENSVDRDSVSPMSLSYRVVSICISAQYNTHKKDGYRQLNVRQLGSLRPWDHRGKCYIEREFNACQTPCSMYPSIFNHFWDIAVYRRRMTGFQQ